MAELMTREEFETPEGQKRAWRSLMFGDHGFLRKVYDNTHQITDEMWRTYQPSPEMLKKWKKRGIRTILNLRGMRRGKKQDGLYFLEEATCKDLGLEFVSFRAFSREAPTKEFVFGLRDLFEKIEYPAMLHCKSGADRAGIASVLYLFLHKGRPFEEALDQLSFKYGHVKEGKTGILDHFFEEYKKAAERSGAEKTPAHFLAWVENEYDKDAVAASFEPTKLGTLVTETILRRE